jgi:hypothetical protein
VASVLRRPRLLLVAAIAVLVLAAGSYAIASPGGNDRGGPPTDPGGGQGGPPAHAGPPSQGEDPGDGENGDDEDGDDGENGDGDGDGDAEGSVHVAADQDELEALLAEDVEPGDLVLLEPGVYPGEVSVAVPGITIRGMDRNEVVFDGGFERGNAITVVADDVVLENMRARDFTGNGFYWTGVEGYAGRYLTTERIGLYGIYAFDSVDGVFEDSYASGSGDAGFYIGQCEPCEAVVRNVTAEHNALGYSGTNAGGDLYLEDSVWSHNAAGIVPNTLDSQHFTPQSEGTVIRGNVLANNGNPETPSYGIAGAIIGHGVAIAGGTDNLIEGNEFAGNTDYGVVIHPLPDDNLWLPEDNVVRDNVFSDTGLADLALAAGSGTGNCFEGNDHSVSLPVMIEQTHACDDPSLSDAPAVGDPVVLSTLAAAFAQASAGIDGRPGYEGMPDAPDEAGMPSPEARDGGVDGGGTAGIPEGYRQGR